MNIRISQSVWLYRYDYSEVLLYGTDYSDKPTVYSRSIVLRRSDHWTDYM